MVVIGTAIMGAAITGATGAPLVLPEGAVKAEVSPPKEGCHVMTCRVVWRCVMRWRCVEICDEMVEEG